MDCPYFKSQGEGYIKCQRGRAIKTAVFELDIKKDKHICIYCNKRYTQCKTYKKLEADWGTNKCSGRFSVSL